MLLVFIYAFALARAMPAGQSVATAACERAFLDDPGLSAIFDHLSDPAATAAEVGPTIAQIEAYGAAHPHSEQFVDLLLAGDELTNAWSDLWTNADRHALLTNYVIHPGNEALIAKSAHVIWYHLLGLIGDGSPPPTIPRLAEAQALLERLRSSAQRDPDTFARTWDYQIWAGGGSTHLPAWDAAKWNALVGHIAEVKRHGYTQRKAWRDNDLMRALQADLDKATGDSVNHLRRAPLQDHRKLLKRFPNYFEVMEEIAPVVTGREIPTGLYLVLLTFRFTRVLAAQLPEGALPAFARAESAYADWVLAQDQVTSDLVRIFNLNENLTADQKATVTALSKDLLFKKRLFENARLGLEGEALAAWRTVRSPGEVQRAVDQLRPGTGSFQKFAHAILSMFGTGVKDLEAQNLYAFYADEIYDALPTAERQTGQTEIRFVRRVLKDLKLGDKIGDCTAVGDVTFAESLSWFYNPGHQLITVRQRGHILVKIGLALMIIDGRPALLIDSLEIHAQAREAGMPLYWEARGALAEANNFLMERARRMQRDLYFYPASNTSWANDYFEHNEDYAGAQTGQLVFDDRSARRALRMGEETELNPYLQVLGIEALRWGSAQTREPDKTLAVLNQRVIAPAIAADGEIGKLIETVGSVTNAEERERTLTIAAKRILAQPRLVAEVTELFDLPAHLPVGWLFFRRKLETLVQSPRLDRAEVSAGFAIRSRLKRVHVQSP